MEALKPGGASTFDAGRVDLPRAEAAVRELLAALGIVAERDPELSQTPKLVAEAWSSELLAGYRMDAAAILADAVATTDAEVISLHDVAVTVMCPHHLLPAPGVVHLAYAPGPRVVGLGALARLVHCHGRRLVLQETLAQNVADALCEHLQARGAACAAVLSPTCVTARGARCHDAHATSFAARGAMAAGQPLHDAAVALLGRRPKVGA